MCLVQKKVVQNRFCTTSNDVTQLIRRKDEILKRLPEHFTSVSNQESTSSAEELVEHPSLEETSTVIEKLSNGMDGTYVNVSKKPTDLDDAYVNVLKKPSGYQ
ncbi:Hypothetical predicted protein [Octopus vulgaris]|uniref:Uncharacterized protein n=1 Tax=Octopus vulgaris TaxID=6645 RepID=A0AA36F308_OCTVU|nr:Hypothetical predicted protein [Octopus vulgaris]